MKKSINYFGNVCVYACLLFVAISCNDTDDFFSSKSNENNSEEAYDFDFSTTRDVDLIVEYNGFETYGPVRFSVYDTNPIVGENTDYEYMNENIKPIIELYTDNRGKFDQTINLPTYAKVLHIVTGNLAIGFSHTMVEVVNGEAKAVIDNDGSTTQSPMVTRAAGPGESTQDMSKLKSTAYEVTSSGTPTSVQVYKEWVTPLGTWNSASGRPDYQLNKATANPGLILSENEVQSMYNTVCNLLPNSKDNSRYQNSSDLTLKKASEVSLTVLGSFTCWNSTLGYYYYDMNTPPTSREDLNIIMLFPNTQDGQRDLSWNYQGNIGTKRGDVIQLKYYPNIASGDLSGETTTFPAGTKIGFIMRSNAWGMMGDEYCSIKKGGSKWNKKMNIWASSTDGMSYANPKINGSFSKPNPNGKARTAEFSYTTSDGIKYVILSFEDACDDYDFNDLIFALNPADVFVAIDELAKDKTTRHGVYAFEDRWPSHSDYDMNDVMVDSKHEIYYENGLVRKECYNLTTYQNFVSDKSGLAIRLKTKVTPKSIVMKKISSGETTAKTVTFTEDETDKGVYYLTSDITRDINSTYIFEITYSTTQVIAKLADIEPFIYGTRKNKDDEYTRWEVHQPGCGPTSHMDMSYFRTHDDFSIFHDGGWYKSNTEYPFAFYLDNATAEDFFETILNPDNESVAISEFYPGFIPWSLSKGAENADWYMHPMK
ncbi:MAG: LruC domain-containing protein [Bacteroidaceae bacterium]|nr:LruC domain-containing protein [Bacteroidaceae bacterium]